MIPYSYNMVDMGGIDLAEANGTVVEGLYNRLALARNACGDLILYNWKFAEIEIAPGICATLDVGSSILINGLIQVTEQDEVSLPGVIPDPPVMVKLEVVKNGNYFPIDYNADGFSEVSVSVPVEEPWREPIFRNWDFSNPVNTRERQSYSGERSINGWTCVTGTTCDLATGGIYVRGSNTNMYYLLDTDAVNYFDGKTFTLSLLANNKLATRTFIFTSSVINQAAVTIDNVSLWCNRDSSTRVAIGFGSNSSGNDTLIQAVKLELGSGQTLAKESDGIWSLIRNQNQNEEIIFTRAMSVNF